MRRIKLIVAVLSFLLSSVVAGHAENAKPEPAPTATPEVNKDAAKQEHPAVVQAASPAAAAADAGAKEKRFVATIGADGIQRVTVTGGEYYFDPNHIVLKVNTPAVLSVMKGKDASWFIPHDLVVKAPGAGIDFKISLKSEPQTVAFTPTKTGTYALYCDKKSPFGKTHREKGMEGVIEVVE